MKFFSPEKFDTHECDLPFKECKNIEVIYFRDSSYKNKKLMAALGIDGVFYTLEVVPRKPLPIVMTPDEFLQYHQSDEDLTEPIPRLKSWAFLLNSS
jgi:hypothetical protein